MAQSAPTRWQRRKEARPKEIIDAAFTLFTERGFSASRLDEVAALAGVTKGTVYLYFPNKEELFKAVVRETILPNIAQFEAMAAQASDATASVEILLSIFRFFPQFIASPAGALLKLVIAEAGNFPDIARFFVEEVIQRARQLLGGMIQRGIERGEFHPVDPASAVFCLFGPAALTMLWRVTFAAYDDPAISVDRICQTLSEIFIGGLVRRDGDA
jgi:AcrR family transcriptional regulator